MPGFRRVALRSLGEQPQLPAVAPGQQTRIALRLQDKQLEVFHKKTFHFQKRFHFFREFLCEAHGPCNGEEAVDVSFEGMLGGTYFFM